MGQTPLIVMVEQSRPRLVDLENLCRYIGMGKTATIEWGKEIGALCHIGRRRLYDLNVVDRAIDNLRESEGQNEG